jgi:glutamate:Na+ symporter, ESS family
LRELISNGRPLLILVALASIFIVVQNIAGIAIAEAFGYDPRIGIVAGSMTLTGRSGTTVAWAPIFQEQFSLEHVSRLGIAINMSGLIAACCIGGPIARFLINRHRLAAPDPRADLDVGFSRDVEAPRLDHHAFLLALLRIHITIIVGQIFGLGIEAAGVRMPLYVSCLVAGIILGNVKPQIAPKLEWPGSDQCLTLIAYISLGLFYAMTLMSMQLWTAGDFLVFVVVVIVVQVLLTIISAGFAGIALGSTATTMAVMTAVTNQYGRAHKAFVVVPLACGIFIDIINSLAITLFSAL